MSETRDRIRRAGILLLIMTAITLTGCAGEWEAEVESTTSWSGSFDGRTVDGRGDRMISVGRDEVTCVVVQKDTRSGSLRVRLRRDHTFMFDEETDWKSTTAEFGVVTVCSDD
ncbi:MAG TPA: hypothetical protein VKA86_13540 [Candidatus Krumholzibacteria bacterium]|nr:hypothetical protein [Candidatus Krumholzibacteria bacterium]